MVRSGIHKAEKQDGRRAVYRFRYDLYVEEMGRYRSIGGSGSPSAWTGTCGRVMGFMASTRS